MTITIHTQVCAAPHGPCHLRGKSLTVIGVWHINRWLRSVSKVGQLIEFDEHTWLQVRADPDDQPHLAPWVVRLGDVEPSDNQLPALAGEE